MNNKLKIGDHIIWAPNRNFGQFNAGRITGFTKSGLPRVDLFCGWFQYPDKEDTVKWYHCETIVRCPHIKKVKQLG